MLKPIMFAVATSITVPAAAYAADPVPVDPAEAATLRAELQAQRAALGEQQRRLDIQFARLREIENRLGIESGAKALAAAPGQPGSVPLPPAPPGTAADARLQTVGEAPTNQREIEVAALAEQGGVITSANRLTLEAGLEYARADRNRVIFRGIEIPQSVLIGVFDINESRQDVLIASGGVRFGLTNRLELNARIPFVYRSDKSVLAPVADQDSPNAGRIDKPVSAKGIGDVEFGARYQITDGKGGWPYLIAGIQAVAPIGRSPFKVSRDELGNALQAATGAGFWGITPSLTAILPTDPAVLFGTLGYTVNFGRRINRAIGPAFVEYVKPGGEPSLTMGIATSLNPQTSLSFGYGHTWSMGTKSRIRMTNPQTGELGTATTTQSRDLQLGRLLLGVSYRVNPKTSINWNVEVGATEDATDLRTSLESPSRCRSSGRDLVGRGRPTRGARRKLVFP